MLDLYPLLQDQDFFGVFRQDYPSGNSMRSIFHAKIVSRELGEKGNQFLQVGETAWEISV
tara:strand:- start:169 stop:348 length:180 start_codon:yes stop_codon:yes gene_type:complete